MRADPAGAGDLAEAGDLTAAGGGADAARRLRVPAQHRAPPADTATTSRPRCLPGRRSRRSLRGWRSAWASRLAGVSSARWRATCGEVARALRLGVRRRPRARRRPTSRPVCTRCGPVRSTRQRAARVLSEPGFADAGRGCSACCAACARRPRYVHALPPQWRERLDAPHAAAARSGRRTPDAGPAGRARRACSTSSRLSAGVRCYLALLVENPLALSQLVKLCAASDVDRASTSARHPILLDELMDPARLYAPLDRDGLRGRTRGRLARLPVDDLEAQMDALREFRHGACACGGGRCSLPGTSTPAT
ncbi:MAG: hypothetical protein MZV65_37390 [Chromatiales bacterium]|nr:hypothetical protein [Chromatiales bacterium]